MSTPISFTIRPPSSESSSSTSRPGQNQDRPPSAAPFRIPTAPTRPSPLSTSSYTRRSEQNNPPRRSAFGGDDDDEDDIATNGRGGHGRQGNHKARDEAITGFNERGVESVNREKPAGPMVIASLPNRDWRQSSHSRSARRPTYMPEGGPRVITADDLVERTGDDVVQGGLQRVESAAPTGEKLDGDVVMAASGDAQPALETPTTTETLEQQALRAVLASGNEDASSSRNMTIDLQTDTLNLLDRPPGDETDAFRQDILTRPEESTMEDYSAVPIESFGAALLRGMGWNPGSGPNPRVHEPKRRPAGLGLGASEKPGSERAQPGKKNETASRTERDRKRKEDYATRGGRGYIPVVKRARESHMDGSSSRAESPASSVVQARSRASSRSPSPRSDTSRRLEREPRDRNGERDTQRRSDDRSTRDRDRDHGSSRRREDEPYRSSRREEKGSRYDSERDHDRDRDRYRDKARERGNRDRRSDKDRDYDRRR